MNFGMLWFNADAKRTFESKVNEAATFHNGKYKRIANCCHVHPSMLLPGVEKVGEIAIVGDKTVAPNYFWVGMAEEKPEANKPEVR